MEYTVEYVAQLEKTVTSLREENKALREQLAEEKRANDELRRQLAENRQKAPSAGAAAQSNSDASETAKPAALTEFAIKNGVLNKYMGRGEDVVVPQGVKTIGERAFAGCDTLKYVYIPNGVSRIGDGAFCGCSSLKGVAVSDTVTSIGKDVFSGCGDLTIFCKEGSYAERYAKYKQLRITPMTFKNSPSPVKSFGQEKAKLTMVTDEFAIENGVLKKYSGKGGDAVIPKGVKRIGDKAFHGCVSLMNVSVPDGVTGIGDSAFGHCKALIGLIIPAGVKRIGDRAFCGCESLTDVSVPDSVTSIGAHAFEGCKYLKSVTIFGSVTSIGRNAFANCYDLTVKCPAGSIAESWCRENNVRYTTSA